MEKDIRKRLYKSKIFMPISIGTSLFSFPKIREILHNLVLYDVEKILCLVCDDLYILGQRALGDSNDSKIRSHAFSQSKRIINIITKYKKNNKIENIEVVTWRSLAELQDFKILLKQLENLLENDKIFNDFVNSIIIELKNRYFNDKQIDKKLEKQYLLWEIAISIYITEIMGYNVEIYPSSDIDFMNYLYKNYSTPLKKLLNNKKLRRSFFSTTNFSSNHNVNFTNTFTRRYYN